MTLIDKCQPLCGILVEWEVNTGIQPAPFDLHRNYVKTLWLAPESTSSI
jgi:hypothetical protein